MNVYVDGEDGPSSIDWRKVIKWTIMPEPEKLIMLTEVEELEQDVVDAKQKELCNLRKNDVFEEIDYEGQPTVSSRWVFTEKNVEGKQVTKARLVARGFEESTQGIRTDSPTCTKYSLRMVMVTAVVYNWEVNSLDIASAFLQGYPIERDQYLSPP